MKVLHPPGSDTERSYTFKVLLGDFLGIEYETKVAPINSVVLQWQGKRLELSDVFFPSAGRDWLHPETLPIRPLAVWDTRELGIEINLINSMIPVIYGRPKCERQDEYCKIDLDIFGSAFFMLSRYEEAVKDARDQFDRFPASASLAYQEGFLNRPIVNEYLEVLWACMRRLWPGLKRKPRLFGLSVSCDVDIPYSYGSKGMGPLLKQIGGDLIKRRSLELAGQSLLNYFRVRHGDYSLDPYFVFDQMMGFSEKAGCRLTFNFICDHSDIFMDGWYSVDESLIRRLMRQIHERGHEIGLHPSSTTYRNMEQMKKEAGILRKVMAEENIQQTAIGGRQHLLKWKTPNTAQNLEAAELAYDSTLGFADHAGFRCGICYEYLLYDVYERRPLALTERPLIAMDSTLLNSDYMNLSHLEVEGMLQYLRGVCEQFNGDFVLLWHNHFHSRNEKNLYQKIWEA